MIIGGPEVSFEHEKQEIAGLADYVITGEADLAFRELCRDLLPGNRPGTKVIPSGLPDLSQVVLPYEDYTAEDIAHRVVYVEASRGCPFTCEFCLSSLDVPVRQFPLPPFLGQLERLLDRGLREFKFRGPHLQFEPWRESGDPGILSPASSPGSVCALRDGPRSVTRTAASGHRPLPPGTLQFEVGIQSFNPEVCKRISRRQDVLRLEDNLPYFRKETSVYVHADLIAGLPGESVESFGAGFDRLVGLGPHEIQVGLLKRLRGTSHRASRRRMGDGLQSRPPLRDPAEPPD